MQTKDSYSAWTAKDRQEFDLNKVLIPPHSDETERAVLGVVLTQPDKCDTLFEIIRNVNVFHDERHRKIYIGLKLMYEAGEAIDLTTLTNYLRRKQQLDNVGGAYGLSEIAMAVVSSAHLQQHCLQLLELWMRRELATNSRRALLSCHDDSNIFEVMEHIQNDIGRLSDQLTVQPYKYMSQVITNTMKNMDVLRAEKRDYIGLNTGFDHLNRLLSGWQKKRLYIVAARPGVGKTGFTLNTALRCAADKVNGGPVAIFNLEMGDTELAKRLLSCVSGVPLDRVTNPSRQEAAEITELLKASQIIANLPLIIDDTGGLTMAELRLKARKMKKKDNISMIIVDYLQLMTGDKAEGNREREIAKISRELKTLAKELDMPIIALSQMTRGVEKEDREPDLSDLRESGAIEQDADVVMFLYKMSKEKMAKLKRTDLENTVTGMVKKWRDGATGEVDFFVDHTVQRWSVKEGGMVTSSSNLMSEIGSQWSSVDDLPF